MAEHHGVYITSDALEAAVQLSSRYINGRQLPDKAVSVLDTACSRVALSQNAIPGLLDSKRKSVQLKQDELKQLEKEFQFGSENTESVQRIRRDIDELSTQVSDLELQWNKEQAWVEQAIALREKLL